MVSKIKRLRRCQLAVPGSSEKMLAKAAAMDVDHVFLDLEDAVAPNAKVSARALIVTALNSLDFGHSVRCVRINDLDSHYAYEDIIAVVEGAGANLDTILVPKVRSACDVRFVDRLLTQIETKLGLPHRIGIEVLIEEAEAIMRVEEIAGASPRRLRSRSAATRFSGLTDGWQRGRNFMSGPIKKPASSGLVKIYRD